jgi:hypothetical protein
MDDARSCNACGASLVGPFDPEVALTLQSSPDEPERDGEPVTVRAWICPACGLAAWYAEEREIDELPEAELDQQMRAKPDSDYERRNQMMHMLRRLRRM